MRSCCVRTPPGTPAIAVLLLLLGFAASAHAQSAGAQPDDELARLMREINALERESRLLLDRISESEDSGLPRLETPLPALPVTVLQDKLAQQHVPPLPAPPVVPDNSTFGSSLDPNLSQPVVPGPHWESPHTHSMQPQHYDRQHYRPRLISKFDDGFVVETEDEEFELRIRLMQQTDFKLFVPTDQEPARPGVYIPRFRSYFEGHITRSFDYELSLQRSVEGEFDVLDANLNFHPSEEFQVKLGRFLLPYSYDWYDHLEQFFITPERALYPLNFGLSREAGAMVWGELNDGRLQYALGGFSGQLAGVADTNTTRDGVAYFNARPFDSPLLENLNVGGSIALGNQAFEAEALPMRTSIQASENDEAAQAASAVFLEFDEDAVILGARKQAAVHMAWYVCQFSLETEFQYGEFRFRTPTDDPTLPVLGYHVTTSYFLTGEEVRDRSLVIPLDPFNPASGQCGLGAIEAFFRFGRLSLGEEVFTQGLADPADWSRSASTIDLGWNWYPNRYVKFYFDWQASLFDSPVLVDSETGKRDRRSDLFWIRAQVFL